MPSYTKDPNAVLDFVWDWTAWLAPGEPGFDIAPETIASATITITPDGMTKTNQTIAGGKVTAWLAGGRLDADHQVTCHIETNQGRQDDRTIRIRVRTR